MLFHIEVIEGLDAKMALTSIGVTVALSELYRDVHIREGGDGARVRG